MLNISIDKIFPGQYALRIDPKFGIIQPWYTHGALDEIQSWNISDKIVLEWGGGCSTFWWSRKCKHVFTIEAHKEWFDWINDMAKQYNFNNISTYNRWPESQEEYVKIPDGCVPDIVCIDGSLRTECLKLTLTLSRPLIIIFDNWMQDDVYFDVEAEKMMLAYPGKFYIQSDHTNHNGHPWQTAIWFLQ